METKTPPSKDEKFWLLLDAVLRLEVTKGHLRWTLSDLSRVTKITRPLIYYYFGKEKSGILDTAISVIGEEIFGIYKGKESFFKTGDFTDSLISAHRIIKKSPHLPLFYLYWRSREGEIGERLMRMENEYTSRLGKALNVDIEKAKAIASLFWGTVSSPISDEESILKAAGFCKKAFSA